MPPRASRNGHRRATSPGARWRRSNGRARSAPAASSTLSTGSPVIALRRLRTAGALSAGAKVPSRMWSASRMRPRPIETRPRSRVRVSRPRLKATTPMVIRIGATQVTSKESTWTMRVVPTLAPSMRASAGTSAKSAARRERGRHQCRRGAALQDRGHEHAREEGAHAVTQRRAQETPEIGAEGAHDAAVDHVQAPQQERHPAHEVKEDHASHGTLPLGTRPHAATRSWTSARRHRQQAARRASVIRSGAMSIGRAQAAAAARLIKPMAEPR